MSTELGPVSRYLRHHFRHFNAAAMLDATDAYARHLEQGGKMLMTLAGAMSTAELGLSLAEMIGDAVSRREACEALGPASKRR